MARPSEYKPQYCEEVLEWMRQGYSVSGFAGKVSVSRQTVYNWADQHPEFLDALNDAKALSAAWWEDRARAVAMGEEGNAAVTIFGLKNRVALDWRERVTVQGDKDADPIQHEHSGAAVSALKGLVDSIAVKNRTPGDPAGE